MVSIRSSPFNNFTRLFSFDHSLILELISNLIFIPPTNRETALKQQEQSKRIQEETKKLLKIYNELMTVVSEQLAVWEAKVQREERKKAEEENTIKSLEEID